jgi:hypothetical protein
MSIAVKILEVFKGLPGVKFPFPRISRNTEWSVSLASGILNPAGSKNSNWHSVSHSPFRASMHLNAREKLREEI